MTQTQKLLDAVEQLFKRDAEIEDLKAQLSTAKDLILEIISEKRQAETKRLQKKQEAHLSLIVTKCNQLHARDAEVFKLKALITKAIPFVGYTASVEDLLKELEDAVDYGKPEQCPTCETALSLCGCEGSV